MYDKDKNLRQIHDTLKREMLDIKEAGRLPTSEERAWANRLMDYETRINNGAEIDMEKSQHEPTKPDPSGNMNTSNAEKTMDPVTDRSFKGMFPQAKTSMDGWKNPQEFLRTFLQGRGDERFQYRAMEGSSGEQGGFLVPSQISKKLLDDALAQETIRPLCQVWPMESSDLYIPSWNFEDLDSSDGAGVTLQWLGESQTASEQNAEVKSLHLKAKTGSIYISVSQELLSDTPAFENKLYSMLSQATARGIDRTLIRAGGDGGAPASILSADCLITVSKEVSQSATTLTYKNAVSAFSRQLDHTGDSCVWLANHDCLPQILAMAQPVGTGGSVVRVLEESNGTYRLLGKRTSSRISVRRVGRSAI